MNARLLLLAVLLALLPGMAGAQTIEDRHLAVAEMTADCVTEKAADGLRGLAWTERHGDAYRVVWMPRSAYGDPSAFAWLELTVRRNPDGRPPWERETLDDQYFAARNYDWRARYGGYPDPAVAAVAFRCVAGSLGLL